jgi:MFS transporter, DHA1 family, multidrug resistance protein
MGPPESTESMQSKEATETRDSTPWKKNLYIIAVAEFLAVAGFTMINPFLPLYLQHFGNFTRDEAAFWSGIGIGGGSIAMFLSAPMWGMLSDRYGRRPMFLRSLFGGAAVLAILILLTNVYAFIGLRVIQGAFTGTVAAASALVATSSPRDKIPLAMGILMGTVYAGNSFGPLMGGYLSDNFGFAVTFMVTAALLAIGGLLVLFFTREYFVPPTKEQRTSLGKTLSLAVSPGLFPLLIVIVATNGGTQMIAPVVTLLIGDINPGGDVASAAGLAFGITAIFASISSFTMGRLAKVISLKNILIFSCLITGLLYILPFWANSVAWIVITVGLTGLVVGGTVVSSTSMVSYTVPPNVQGIAYGVAQSATGLGRGIGPMIGGALVPWIGLRPVFLVVAGIFLVMTVYAAMLFRRGVLGGKKG